MHTVELQLDVRLRASMPWQGWRDGRGGGFLGSVLPTLSQINSQTSRWLLGRRIHPFLLSRDRVEVLESSVHNKRDRCHHCTRLPFTEFYLRLVLDQNVSNEYTHYNTRPILRCYHNKTSNSRSKTTSAVVALW